QRLEDEVRRKITEAVADLLGDRKPVSACVQGTPLLFVGWKDRRAQLSYPQQPPRDGRPSRFLTVPIRTLAWRSLRLEWMAKKNTTRPAQQRTGRAVGSKGSSQIRRFRGCRPGRYDRADRSRRARSRR